jgi:hypothetical protein
MGNEATMAGLELKPSRAVWDWTALESDEPTKSLNYKWWLLELLPIKHLTYKDATHTYW